MIVFLFALSLLLSITFPSAFHTHCFHFAAQRYSLFLSLTSLICSIVHFVVSFLLLLPIIAILPLLFATILLLMVSAIILCVSLPNLNLFNSFRSATRNFLSADQRAYLFSLCCSLLSFSFIARPLSLYAVVHHMLFPFTVQHYVTEFFVLCWVVVAINAFFTCFSALFQ